MSYYVAIIRWSDAPLTRKKRPEASAKLPQNKRKQNRHGAKTETRHFLVLLVHATSQPAPSPVRWMIVRGGGVLTNRFRPICEQDWRKTGYFVSIEEVLDLWVQLVKNGSENKCCLPVFAQCGILVLWIWMGFFFFLLAKPETEKHPLFQTALD